MTVGLFRPPGPFPTLVSLQDMLRCIQDCGWEHARTPERIRSLPPVADALSNAGFQFAAVSETDGDIDDVISVRNITFIPANEKCTRFLKFDVRSDYILHNV